MLFQDGGLLALGANAFNMGIIGTLGGTLISRAVALAFGSGRAARIAAATPQGGGSVTRAIISDQFRRLRDGDRFWYQNLYSGSTLADIQGTSLADIIKLMMKEELRPKAADSILFYAAPILSATAAFAAFAVVPFGASTTFFGLLAEPAHHVAEADHIVAVVLKAFRQQKGRDAERGFFREDHEAVFAHRCIERRAEFFPVRNQLVDRARVHDGAR